MFRTLSLAVTVAVLPLSAMACDGFEAHDAYARVATATAQSGAAFMILHNHGTADCHIANVHSDAAARAELHSHTEDAQAVMRMQHVAEGFALPVDGEIVLERGGHHVMLLGLAGSPTDGDTIDLTFVFADGAERVVEVVVDNQREPAAHGHSHGHGHSHSHGH